MKVIGVDPGVKGALATWNGRTLQVVDVPIVKSRGRGYDVNIPALVELLERLADPKFQVAYVELSGSRRKEGVGSAHKNGLVTGVLLGTVAVHCHNIRRPAASKWKRAMGLTKDKNYSRAKAIELFPRYHRLFSRVKDHGRAEAALLALYGYRQLVSDRG